MIFNSNEGIKLRRAKWLRVCIVLVSVVVLLLLVTGCSALNKAFSKPVIELNIITSK